MASQQAQRKSQSLQWSQGPYVLSLPYLSTYPSAPLFTTLLLLSPHSANPPEVLLLLLPCAWCHQGSFVAPLSLLSSPCLPATLSQEPFWPPQIKATSILETPYLHFTADFFQPFIDYTLYIYLFCLFQANCAQRLRLSLPIIYLTQVHDRNYSL